MLYYADEGVLARRGVVDGKDPLKGRAACRVLGGDMNSDRELIELPVTYDANGHTVISGADRVSQRSLATEGALDSIILSQDSVILEDFWV